MTVVADLERFILDEIVIDGVSHIEPDEDLLASGIVDSFGLQQLLSFIDERYGVAVDMAELTPANFQSLHTIEAFIEARVGGRAC